MLGILIISSFFCCIPFITACAMTEETAKISNDSIMDTSNDLCGLWNISKDTAKRSNNNLESLDHAVNEFQKRNEKAIRKLRLSSTKLNYAFCSMENYPYIYVEQGKTMGVYQNLLNFIEDTLDLSFYEVEDLDVFSGIDALAQNQIQILFGMTFSKDTIEKQVWETKGIQLSEPLIEDSLVLMSRISKKLTISKEEIPFCYWGTLEFLFELGNSDAILKGHLISYNALSELIKAAKQSEIQGVLLKSSSTKYYLKQMNKEQLVLVPDYYLSIEERLAYSKQNDEFNQLISELSSLYFSYHVPLEEKEKVDLLSLVYIKMIAIVFLLCSFIIFLTLLIRSIHLQRSRKKVFHKLQLRMQANENSSFELFYIDFTHGTIKASKRFASFELPRKKKMKIRDLSKKIGFNYTAHYKSIALSGKEEFVDQYDLFLKGKRYQMKEYGVSEGCYFITRIQRFEKG